MYNCAFVCLSTDSFISDCNIAEKLDSNLSQPLNIIQNLEDLTHVSKEGSRIVLISGEMLYSPPFCNENSVGRLPASGIYTHPYPIPCN